MEGLEGSPRFPGSGPGVLETPQPRALRLCGPPFSTLGAKPQGPTHHTQRTGRGGKWGKAGQLGCPWEPTCGLWGAGGERRCGKYST